ncbi:MAG: hypothetical protein AB8G22_10320 [Saprospiraceae bacterium]
MRTLLCSVVALLALCPNQSYGQIQTVLAGKAKNLIVRNSVKPDWEAAPSPAMTMESLLDHLKMDMKVDGTFEFNGHIAAFLPPQTVKGKKIRYNNNVYVTGELVKVEGGKEKKIKGYTFATVDDLAPMYKLRPKQPGIIPTKLKEGDYILKYSVFNELIYQFPFKVEKKVSDDPYSQLKEMYFLAGPWEEWNALDIDEDDDNSLMWYTYATHRSTKVKNRITEAGEYTYRCELFYNGQKVGFHDNRRSSGREHWKSGPHGEPYTNTTTRGQWARQNMNIVHVSRKDPHGRPANFLKSDLRDGNYNMKVYIDGKLSEFPFQVKGGELVKHQQQVREQHDDPTTLIEGGREYFWYQRK